MSASFLTDLSAPHMIPKPVLPGHCPYTSGFAAYCLLHNDLPTTYAGLQKSEKDASKVFRSVVVLGMKTPFGRMMSPFKKANTTAGKGGAPVKRVSYSVPQLPCIEVSEEFQPGEIKELTLYQFTLGSKQTDRDARRDDRKYKVEVGACLTFHVPPHMYVDSPQNGSFQNKQIIFGSGDVIRGGAVVELVMRPTPCKTGTDDWVDGYCLKVVHLEELPACSPYTFLTPHALRSLPDTLEVALQRQADRSAQNAPIAKIMDPTKCWLCVPVPRHCHLVHGSSATDDTLKIVPDGDQPIFPGCYVAEFPTAQLERMLNCPGSTKTAETLFDSAIAAGAAYLIVFASCYKKDDGAGAQTYKFTPLMDPNAWFKPVQFLAPPPRKEKQYYLFPTGWRMDSLQGPTLCVDERPALDRKADLAPPCPDFPLAAQVCASGARLYEVRVLDSGGHSFAEVYYNATGAVSVGGGGGQRMLHVGIPFLNLASAVEKADEMAEEEEKAEEEEPPAKKCKTEEEPAKKCKTEEEPAKKSKTEEEPAKKSKTEEEPAKKSKTEKEPAKKSKGGEVEEDEEDEEVEETDDEATNKTKSAADDEDDEEDDEDDEDEEDDPKQAKPTSARCNSVVDDDEEDEPANRRTMSRAPSRSQSARRPRT